jgi:transposase
VVSGLVVFTVATSCAYCYLFDLRNRSRLEDYLTLPTGLVASTLERSVEMAKPKGSNATLPVLNPYAAGIDIGSDEVFVAIPQDADPNPVRRFPTFTRDFYAIADWLKEKGIQTVAMESTGVYWIPLFQILEERGFQVCLVNARHLNNVPGKTDVADSQWIQFLHSCGLLTASFRPEQAVCAVRALLRHREGLVRHAASHIQHMQKAMVQMNIRLQNVISDITGKTGLAILDAILDGERDPKALAELRDPRIKASEETVVKSLEGDYRPEHLFTLRQALGLYRTYQAHIRDCDAEIERMLSEFDSRFEPPAGSDISDGSEGSEGSDGSESEQSEQNQQSKPKSTSGKTAGGNALRFQHTDLNSEVYRLFGTDLTLVPSFGALTLITLFAEAGRDLRAFPSDKRYVSWLGLCPGNKITGGKVISTKTNSVASRSARAFRMAAQGLWNNRSPLGDYYRRMAARLGKQEAITATAHKLARIYYHLVTTRETYDESKFNLDEAVQRKKREARLRREAQRLGLEIVPQPTVT